MKKAITIVVCVCILVCVFVGCTTTTTNASGDERMVLVERTVHNNGTCTAYVLVDRETGIAYLSVHGSGTVMMADDLGYPLTLYEYKNK